MTHLLRPKLSADTWKKALRKDGVTKRLVKRFLMQACAVSSRTVGHNEGSPAGIPAVLEAWASAAAGRRLALRTCNMTDRL
jgi:hypothetical protein